METLYDLFEESWNKRIEMAKKERDEKIDKFETTIARAKRDIEWEIEKLESLVKRKENYFERYKTTLDAWKKGIFDFAYGGYSQVERLSYSDYENGDCSEEAIREPHFKLSDFVDDMIPCFTVFFKDDPKMKCLGCNELFEKLATLLRE